MIKWAAFQYTNPQNAITPKYEEMPGTRVPPLLKQSIIEDRSRNNSRRDSFIRKFAAYQGEVGAGRVCGGRAAVCRATERNKCALLVRPGKELLNGVARVARAAAFIAPLRCIGLSLSRFTYFH